MITTSFFSLFSFLFYLRNNFGGLLNFYGESRPSPEFFCFPLFCVRAITNQEVWKKRVKRNLCSWLRLGQRRSLGSINKWPVRWCRRRSARIRLYPRHILTVRCRSRSCRRWPTPPPSRSERYCSLRQHLCDYQKKKKKKIRWMGTHIVRFISFFRIRNYKEKIINQRRDFFFLLRWFAQVVVPWSVWSVSGMMQIGLGPIQRPCRQ